MRVVLTAILCVGLWASPALAQDPGGEARPELVTRSLALLGRDDAARREALLWFETRQTRGDAPALIQVLRFTIGHWHEIVETLAVVVGEHGGDTWEDWVLWQERQDDLAPSPGFVALKSELYGRLDPAFRQFIAPGIPHAIRLEEIVWGGVKTDGIPALDAPARVTAAEATYLAEDAPVFGVEINGDARAYPLRIMDWHEMLNDVIGGVPVSLAYCTLCASGILFEGQVAGREAPFTFGSSGLLYRSNKLMVDRQTQSLWSQFTGRPVVGPLVGSGLELATRPVVITSWAEGRAAHPDTTVLSLETGFDRDYTPGAAYGGYFKSPSLMFPANVADRALDPKAYVFALRGAAHEAAWPLSRFTGGAVLNDRAGAVPVTLVGDAATRTVRAYRTQGERFERAASTDLATLRLDGAIWRVTEDALIGPDGATRHRLPGHIAYWFAWSSAFGAEGALAARGRPQP